MIVPRCTVATINLLVDQARWADRMPLLVEGLAELQADLIALQEVVLPANTARRLAEALQRRDPSPERRYTVHLSPKTGPARETEGLAILSRLPVEHHDVLDLQTQNRVAQAVRVRLDGGSLTFANCHLFWHPGESMERLQQVERLLDWLSQAPAGTPVVVCGDFNGVPNSAAIRRMRERFASAHARCHGGEPEYTCPTPLMQPDTITRLGGVVLNLIQNRRLRPWRGTLDYIFVNDCVRVVSCDVVLNRPAPFDRTLYPSDHFGLAATLEVDGG